MINAIHSSFVVIKINLYFLFLLFFLNFNFYVLCFIFLLSFVFKKVWVETGVPGVKPPEPNVVMAAHNI